MASASYNTVTTSSQPAFTPTKKERSDQAILVTRLFNKWQLDNKTQLNLLGLSPASRSVLPKYRDGSKGIPQQKDQQDRVAYLLGIHKALRMLYPRNNELLYGWINKRNQYLDGKAPIEIMTDEGLLGIYRVYQLTQHLLGR